MLLRGGGNVYTIVVDNKIRIINMDISFPPWKSTKSGKKNNLVFVNRIEVGKEVVTKIAVSFPPFPSQWK